MRRPLTLPAGLVAAVGVAAGALLLSGAVASGRPSSPVPVAATTTTTGADVSGCCTVVRDDVAARWGRLAPRVARSWQLDALPVQVAVIETAASLPTSDRVAGGAGWVAVTAGSAAAPRIVVAADAWSRLATLPRDLVVAHELAHVAAREAGGGAAPAWLDEGHAEWLARRLTGAAALTTSGHPPHDGPPQAADFGGATASWAYATATAMVDALADRVGPAGLVDLHVAVARAGAAGSGAAGSSAAADRVLRARAGTDVEALITSAASVPR